MSGITEPTEADDLAIDAALMEPRVMPEDAWDCVACERDNDPWRLVCTNCGKARA